MKTRRMRFAGLLATMSCGITIAVPALAGTQSPVDHLSSAFGQATPETDGRPALRLDEDPPQEVLAAIAEANPQLDSAGILDRLTAEIAAGDIAEQLSSGVPAAMAGGWMNPNEFTLHVNVRDDGVERAAEIVGGAQIRVQIHAVTYSWSDLEARSDLLYYGSDPILGDLSEGFARIDLTENMVYAGVDESEDLLAADLVEQAVEADWRART